MRVLLTFVIFLLLVTAAPMWAQDSGAEETPEATEAVVMSYDRETCRTEAQVWYDAIDPDETLHSDFYASVNEARMSDRVAARDRFLSEIERTLALELPACLADIHTPFAVGIMKAVEAISVRLDGNAQGMFEAMIIGSSAVGFVRGYLTLLGVELDSPGTAGFRLY